MTKAGKRVDVPEPPDHKTGKRVAVIGSGPAGWACSQQLARAGHDVVLFEKNDRIGGLLRYGIPDFKMEKWLIDRRIEQMRQEGVEFRPGVCVGTDQSFPTGVTNLATKFITAQDLVAEFDAVVVRRR
jgi:glutamate synthase (NADPH/NADH) small chain